MSGTETIPADCPTDLARALGDRGAHIVWERREGPRMYLRAEAADGELFAWYTHSPGETGMVAREAAFRAQVGTQGVLRAPPLLAFGENWRVEPFVRSAQLHGPAAIDAAVAASQELFRLSLPASAPPAAKQAARAATERRLRVAASPLPIRDVLRSRSLMRSCTLPLRVSHGEFSPIHLFYDDGAVWVIDWDLAGLRPAGYDLMQLWVALESNDDRAHLFEAAVRLLGPGTERELAKVRYATLVRAIASAFGEEIAINRDPALGRRLVELLPEVRSAAAG